MFEFLKKRDHSAHLEPDDVTVVVKAGDKLLNAALAAGLDWPHDCRVGSCGTCRCILKSGTIKRLTDFSYTLTPDDLRAGAILACQSQLRSDVVVEIELGAANSPVALEHHDARIARTRYLTHDIQQVDIAVEHGAFTGAKAGQYAELSVPGIAEARSYSFAHAPTRGPSGQVSFFIRHVPGGAFTDWLFAAGRAGASLTMSGPYGGFYYRTAAGRMICIAGGSGLAPIHAVLEEAGAAGVVRDCQVLFGARTQADLYYLDERAALGRTWRGAFDVIPVLSMEAPDSGWRGARGLVTDALASIAGSGFGRGDQGYLCGPPPMVDAGIAALQARGVSADAIYCDKFLDASTQPGGRAALSA